MKNFFYIVLFSALVTGCNSNSAPIIKESKTAENAKPGETYWDTTGDVNVDTIGLARNKAIKAARLLESNSVFKNSSSGRNEINADNLSLAEYKRKIAKTDPQSIEVPTSLPETTMESINPDRTQNSTANKTQNSTTSKTQNSTTGTKETVAQKTASEIKNKSADSAKAVGSTAAQTKEKKEVSKKNRTKGAIIGAVSGAAAGAVINKRNRKVGGVVGGIIGAAAGYGLGRNKDKKDTAAKRGNQ